MWPRRSPRQPPTPPFPVYQTIQRTGTGRSPECDAYLVWFVDNFQVSIPSGASKTSVTVGTGTDAISPGHATITLQVKNGNQLLSEAELQIWVTLPRELLYDVGATIWRTDAKYNIQVTTGGNPAWNPADPNRIAFVRNDATDGEIWVINRDRTTGLQQITNNSVDEYAPSWSNDGVRLVYSREISGQAEVVVQLPAPGLNAALLTSNTFNDDSPHWFGNLILYHANGGGTTNSYTLRADLPPFQTPVQIPNTTNGFDPRWSSNGSQFVFSRPRGGSTNPTAHTLVLIDANGLNSAVKNFASGPSHNREPDLSPEGLIAFVSNAGGSVDRIWI